RAPFARRAEGERRRRGQSRGCAAMMPAQRFNLSAAALRHRTLTLFFLLLLTLAGVMAYANLGLKEEPEFKFKLMVIRVLWPGASAQEIEQQVTDKIEK